MNDSLEITPEEFARFNKERTRVIEAFRKRGRGSQQAAAFDLHISPSRVSTVLRGISVDWGVLNKLSTWVEERAA